MQDKDGKCLTEGEDKNKRLTEYCSELYTFHNKGDPSVCDYDSVIFPYYCNQSS